MTTAGNHLISGPVRDPLGNMELVPEEDLEYKKVEEYVVQRYGHLNDNDLTQICTLEGGAWQRLLNMNVLARTQNTSLPDDLVKSAFTTH